MAAAPKDLKTPEQLEEYLTQNLRDQIAGLAPRSPATTDIPARWDAARSFLLKCLKVRVGLTNPSPAEIAAHEVRRVSGPGAGLLAGT